MNCANVLENMVPFLDGEMDDADSWQIRRHLAICFACRKEAQIYSETWDLFGKIPDLELKEIVGREIQGKVRTIHREDNQPLLGKLRWLRTALLASAACLIITLTVYMLMPTSKPVNNTGIKVVVKNNNDGRSQPRIKYYRSVFANYQTNSDEDYWYNYDSKTLSPYLTTASFEY